MEWNLLGTHMLSDNNIQTFDCLMSDNDKPILAWHAQASNVGDSLNIAFPVSSPIIVFLRKLKMYVDYNLQM